MTYQERSDHGRRSGHTFTLSVDAVALLNKKKNKSLYVEHLILQDADSERDERIIIAKIHRLLHELEERKHEQG